MKFFVQLRLRYSVLLGFGFGSSFLLRFDSASYSPTYNKQMAQPRFTGLDGVLASYITTPVTAPVKSLMLG